MPEIGLQGAGVVAVVGQRVAAGVAQHVRVDLERHPGFDAGPFHHPREPGGRKRPSPLAGEHERRCRRLLPLQAAQRPQLVAQDRVGSRGAALDPSGVQGGAGEVDLVPAQVDQLGDPEASLSTIWVPRATILIA